MSRLAVVLSAAASCLALATVAQAQDTTKAPAPAPAPAPGADSAHMYVGDWEWLAGSGERQVDGVWRINYANGRFTGIVARPGVPTTPISSFTLRNGREFTLTCEINAETWTFSGRLENVRNISGTLSRRGGIDRLRAQKRAG